jgi:hypothetical protein
VPHIDDVFVDQSPIARIPDDRENIETVGQLLARELTPEGGPPTLAGMLSRGRRA